MIDFSGRYPDMGVAPRTFLAKQEVSRRDTTKHIRMPKVRIHSGPSEGYSLRVSAD